MAEGPIRRACNRCHNQKLSCKRLGNEPCERCVRLKAECKSSPSLRFRKPSNGSNSGSKSSNLQQASATQQSQQPQKNTSLRGKHVPGYTIPSVPYPGPYSFDGITEHLWPGHNVDAGLLIYHSDGNQIYQALPTPHVPFVVKNHKPSREGVSTNLGGENLGPAHMFSCPPTATELLLFNGLTRQWPVSNVSYGTSCTDLVDTNGSDWQHGLKLESPSKTSFETSLLSHSCEPINYGLQGDAGKSQSTYATKMGGLCMKHDAPRGSSKTVPRSLLSALCDMSARLWDMSNSVPPLRFTSSVHIDETCTPVTSMAFHTDGSYALPSSGLASRTSGGTPFSPSTNDQSFPMDSLFSVSRKFIETVQCACRVTGGELPLHRRNSFGQSACKTVPRPGPEPLMASNNSDTGTLMDICDDRVDAESFVLLADSTYAALLDVYQRVFHLVNATAVNERNASPPRSDSGIFMNTKEHLEPPPHVVAAPSSWKDAAARACLKICHFPDVSVGGFPIASTPALQLGLGLRLADDFLVQFSHAVAEMHSSFPPAMHVDGMTTSVMTDQQPQQLPTVTSSSLPHPPLVLSESFITNEGYGAYMDWSTSTAASMTSSGNTNTFSPQSGVGLCRTSSMDDIVVRELGLRHELAGLRNKLAA